MLGLGIRGRFGDKFYKKIVLQNEDIINNARKEQEILIRLITGNK